MRRVQGIKPATARKLTLGGLTVNNTPFDTAHSATVNAP
jgi:hypothetical protein